jgi:hypothetical protein
MSKTIDDVKAGVKGVRGMGDVLRGEMMGATDKVFESSGSKPGHEADVRSQAKHQAIKDKGRQDIQGMDDMFARREWSRKGARPAGEGGLEREEVPVHEDVPGQTQPATESEILGDDQRLGAPVHRQPPVDTGHHRTGHPAHAVHEKPAEGLGQEQGLSGQGLSGQGLTGRTGEDTRPFEGEHYEETKGQYR